MASRRAVSQPARRATSSGPPVASWGLFPDRAGSRRACRAAPPWACAPALICGPSFPCPDAP
eukprot:125409-Alexandrium_andersonii.AAC.1